jgi:hypothetical protein
MNIFWLLRLRRWAQNPPGARAALAVGVVVVLCLALFALERWLGGWPAALTPDTLGRGVGSVAPYR